MNKKLIFIALTAIIAAIPFVCQVYYTSADDFRYIALVSGAYTGTPVKELVYVCSILGGIEAFLYSKFPSIEWYSVIYYVLTLSSFCTLLLIALEQRINRWIKRGIILISFIAQIYLSLTPQFTTLATQLGFTSLIIVLYANGRKKWYLWSFILFFFATQLRLVATFLPFMIASPLFFRDMQIGNINWWKKKAYLGLFIIIALATFVSEKYVYRSDEWQYFNRVNDARGYVCDNPFAGNYATEIKNQEDSIAYELYYKYRIFDIDILTPEKLDEYQATFKSRILQTIKFNVRPYFEAYVNLGSWFMIFIAFVLIFELIRKREWNSMMVYLSCVALFIIANLQMMSTSFPKERVLLCLYVTMLYITLTFVYHHVCFSKWIIIGVCVMMSVRCIDKGYEYVCATLYGHEKYLEIEHIMRSPKIKKVLFIGSSNINADAFHISSSTIFRKSIFNGWMHIYPLANTEYQHFTSYVDGLPIFVEKSKAGQVDLICKLLKLHYHIDASPKVLLELENYQLIKLIKKNNKKN